MSKKTENSKSYCDFCDKETEGCLHCKECHHMKD